MRLTAKRAETCAEASGLVEATVDRSRASRSSPCAARPAVAGKRSGSDPATRQPPPDPALTGHASPTAATYPSVTYKSDAHPSAAILQLAAEYDTEPEAAD